MADPVVVAPKVGWKTSEFWLTLVAVLIGALAASGAIVETSMVGKIVGVAGSVLAAMGYTYSRSIVKAP